MFVGDGFLGKETGVVYRDVKKKKGYDFLKISICSRIIFLTIIVTPSNSNSFKSNRLNKQ